MRYSFSRAFLLKCTVCISSGFKLLTPIPTYPKKATSPITAGCGSESSKPITAPSAPSGYRNFKYSDLSSTVLWSAESIPQHWLETSLPSAESYNCHEQLQSTWISKKHTYSMKNLRNIRNLIFCVLLTVCSSMKQQVHPGTAPPMLFTPPGSIKMS